MKPEDYRRILRNHWLLIVLCTVLGGALGLGIALLQPKVYTADSQSFVAISSADPANANIGTGAGFISERVNSYGQLVTSPQVLKPVIASLHLNETVDSLGKKVTAVSPPQTVLINVTANYSSPAMAAQIADAVSEQLGRTIETIETPTGNLVSPVRVTLTDPASAPGGPSSPRVTLDIVLGLLLGLGLSLAYTLLRETLDTTINHQEELSEITGGSSLALMAYDGSAVEHPLVALDQRSLRAEAFRTLRTNLTFVDVDSPPKVIAVTSGLRGEGKTTTSCNLAITMAQAGMKVCLVEADLRRPRVAPYLGIEGAVGLTNVLRST